MPGVREHPPQPEPGQLRHGLAHRDGPVGRDPDAPVPDVDLQEDVQRPSGIAEGPGQGGRPLDAVHPHGEAHAVSQRHEPPALVLAHDGVGDEEVVEAGVGEDLRLADLGDGEPPRARGALKAGDLRALVGLGVGTQPHARVAGPAGHSGDVALEHVEVDEDRRCREVVEALADHARKAITGPWFRGQSRRRTPRARKSLS